MPETNNVVAFNADRPRRPRRAKTAVPAGAPLRGLIESWQLALEAQKKAKYTIELYTRSATRFVGFLEAHGFPADAEGVTAEHVRRFLISEEQRTSVHTSSAHHAYLSVWFNWLIEEKERTTFSPVLKADKPHVPKKARKYLTDDELTALVNACKGSDFLSRRNMAIVRTLMDNGMRVSGLVGLQLDDVFLREKQLRIRLKGGDEHWAPIGTKTVAAIDRYLRVRAGRPGADSPCLWLGWRGAGTRGMTRSGMTYLLAELGERAGVANVHPHRFRGTAAHTLLAGGASVDDVQSIMGWKDANMVRHYTSELAAERARATHARLSPGDRI